MKTAGAGKTPTTEVIAPKSRKKIGKTTFIIVRHFTGARSYASAITDVVMNEAGRYENDPDDGKMDLRKVSGEIAADPVSERRTEI